MASSINANIPVANTDIDANPIRGNFQAAKSEIEELQEGDAKKLRGRDVSSAAPTSGQALVWNQTGNHWRPETIHTDGGGGGGDGGTVTEVIAGTGLSGGSITHSGTISLATPVSVAHGGTGATTAAQAKSNLGIVEGGGDAESIHGRAISSAAPSVGEALVWHNLPAPGRREPQAVSGGGGGGGAVALYSGSPPWANGASRPASDNGTIHFNSGTGVLSVWAQVAWVSIN